MNYVTVYRIENENKSGPYHTGVASDLGHSIDLSTRRPSVWYDGVDDFHWFEFHRYGFKSLYWLRRWFPKNERKDFKNKTDNEVWQITVYKVPKDRVRFGRKQLVFDFKYAEEIEVLDIETLEKVA